MKGILGESHPFSTGEVETLCAQILRIQRPGGEHPSTVGTEPRVEPVGLGQGGWGYSDDPCKHVQAWEPGVPYCELGLGLFSPLKQLSGELRSLSPPFSLLAGPEAPDRGDPEHRALPPCHYSDHPPPRLQVPAGLLRGEWHCEEGST